MTSNQLTRRTALLGLGLCGLSASPVFALASGAVNDRKLVVVILRGAMDGLSALPPFADPDYVRLRSKIRIGAPGTPDGALVLGAGFGLHPSLKNLHEAWKAGELIAIPATASPYRDRSHFDAQDVLESGTSKVFGSTDGWLNRAIGLTKGREAVAIAPSTPLILRGPNTISTWAPSALGAADSDLLSRLMELYTTDPALKATLAAAISTDAMVGDSMSGMSGKGKGRGVGAAPELATAAAKLLKAPNGPGAAVLSIDGWDTHANQGAANGVLATRLAGLDNAVGDLKTELGPEVWSKTAVLIVTEFGRTAAENGAGGTDHGTGAVAFLVGGAVKGGRVAGDWPGLSAKALFENRDVAPANDIRSVFKGVLSDHWGLTRAELGTIVFPDTQGLAPMAGLIRS